MINSSVWLVLASFPDDFSRALWIYINGCLASAARQADGEAPGSGGPLSRRSVAPTVLRLVLRPGQLSTAGEYVKDLHIGLARQSSANTLWLADAAIHKSVGAGAAMRATTCLSRQLFPSKSSMWARCDSVHFSETDVPLVGLKAA